MQLCEPPRGGQLSIHGNVVNVPADVNSTVSTLIRLINESQTISEPTQRYDNYDKQLSLTVMMDRNLKSDYYVNKLIHQGHGFRGSPPYFEKCKKDLFLNVSTTYSQSPLISFCLETLRLRICLGSKLSLF